MFDVALLKAKNGWLITCEGEFLGVCSTERRALKLIQTLCTTSRGQENIVPPIEKGFDTVNGYTLTCDDNSFSLIKIKRFN